MSPQIPTIKLCDESNMPFLGLGTYDSLDENELSTAIKAAINSGYRHFDCGTIFILFQIRKLCVLLLFFLLIFLSIFLSK